MSAYSISPDYDELLKALYRGPLEEQPWQHFLQLLRDALGANYATLMLRPPSEGDAGLVLNASLASTDVYQSYNHKYFALDPFVNLPPGVVVTLREFVDNDKLADSDYYQQYIAPIDVFHILGVDMLTDEGLSARLRICRNEQAGDFGDEQKQLVTMLLPHLEQSIVLHANAERTESERALLADAIDQLAMGCVVLDGTLQVLRTNRAADRLLEAHQQLAVRGGKLQLSATGDQRAFKHLLEQVVAAHIQGEPGFVKAFRVGAAESSTSLGLLLRPLPQVASSQDSSQPSVAVFISDPNERRSAPSEILADLFDFTPAESNLALLLANGLTLDEASEELGVSRNTAKSHLSAVFSKTGLTRQTKLVQLILKSVASFGSPL